MNTAATIFALLGTGFLLGLKHALDADHVAVVSTMVSQTKSMKKSSLLGVLWGLGHTATLLLVGLVVLLLNITIPARAALLAEFAVGLVVVFFGAELLRKIVRRTLHSHRHTHDGTSHAHLHGHGIEASHRHHHRAFAIGTLHGLAGSAALTLLVLTTVQSTLQGIVFILLFGLGSIISMLLASTAIGLPFLLTTRFAKLKTTVQALAGTMSIIIGLTILVQVGIFRGLFA